MDKNSPANAGDKGLIPGSGKIPHATATGDWWATVDEVTESDTTE